MHIQLCETYYSQFCFGGSNIHVIILRSDEFHHSSQLPKMNSLPTFIGEIGHLAQKDRIAVSEFTQPSC